MAGDSLAKTIGMGYYQPAFTLEWIGFSGGGSILVLEVDADSGRRGLALSPSSVYCSWTTDDGSTVHTDNSGAAKNKNRRRMVLDPSHPATIMSEASSLISGDGGYSRYGCSCTAPPRKQ